MLKKAVLFYNPQSGSQGVQNRLSYIAEKFSKHNIFLHIMPVNADNIDMQHEIFKRDNFNYDFIVVSGGDGSVNQIVNKMLHNGIYVPVGIIPGGTFNDFSRCISVPNSLDKCLDIILNGKTLKVDIGKGNDKYFLDTFAGGLFVDVSINTPSIYKRRFGPLAYYVNGLNELKNLRSFDISIETEGQSFEGKILVFLLLNGNHGAGFDHLIKNADLSDGIMDMILIRDCSYIDLANLFIKQLNRSLISDPNVIHIPLRKCTIKGDESLIITMDGEECGKLPMNIEVLKGALEVFVP